MVTVDEVIAQLDPKIRKNLFVGDEMPETILQPTASYGLNRALGGGLPYGRRCLSGAVSHQLSHLCAFKWLALHRKKERYVHGLMLKCRMTRTGHCV